MYSTVYNRDQKRSAIETNVKFEHSDDRSPHSPIGKATAMVVACDPTTISCHLYGDIKSYVIIYLRKQRAT